MMNVLKSINELKEEAKAIDPLYMANHSVKEWDNYYMSKIKPLEDKAREALIVNAGIEPTKENVEIVHHFMTEDNYGSPLEAVVKSPVSLSCGCKLGSTPETNLQDYLDEIDLIKTNFIK